jgi:uncharacterized membrane protein
MEKILAVPISEQSALRYYWDNYREWRQDSLLFYPIVCMLGAFVLVGITREIDTYLTTHALLGSWWMTTSNIIITITSTISSSMLSLLAIGFSISLFALQMANQQYSPRVTSIFLRSAITKLTISIIIGTFVYSFVLMFEVLRIPTTQISIISLLTVVLLIFTSLIVFIYFMKSVLIMIRVSNIITIIEEATQKSIVENLQIRDQYISCQAISLKQPSQIIKYTRLPNELFNKRYENGVFTRLEYPELVKIAADHDCVLRIIPQFGDIINVGDPIIEVYGGSQLDPARALKGFYIEPEQGISQDPAYGIRMLVDIALQALSPAINAPTTTHLVIVRLTNILSIIADRPQHSGVFADRHGHLRLLHSKTSWDEFVDQSYDEIIHYGSRDPQTRKSLANSFDYLLARIPDDLRAPILRKKAQLLTAEVGSAD